MFFQTNFAFIVAEQTKSNELFGELFKKKDFNIHLKRTEILPVKTL